jgi:hypothetical protein
MWINTGNSPTRDLKVVVKYALLDAPMIVSQRVVYES